MTFIQDLQTGKIRAAHKDTNGTWQVDLKVKEGILEIFRTSQNIEFPMGYIDKEALKPREFSVQDNIRMVPYGSAVRAGAYIAEGVVIMPPSFVNIGAYIDTKTMIDSHVLVGSCAQIGKNVHLSAAVQIGGVLEPIGLRPCIVEDDVFIGAGSIITEGLLIKRGAVIASGVILSKSVPIFDTIHNTKYYGEIPENAVVVPGSRVIKDGLSINCGIIVKYRDANTEKSIALEEALR